jgi:LPXTG-site transpeptidase (sortase) family protein
MGVGRPKSSTASTATGTPKRTTPAQPSQSEHGAPHRSTGRTKTAAGSRQFMLVVAMRSATIGTNVAPIDVSSNEPVDPPHETAAQWNTAAWVEQSTYPSTPGKGTTYVYGHACHYHTCPFTNLKDARVGDQVRVTASARVSTYTIERVGLSPKSASSLSPWASDSTVPDRIVLVTCAYEQGDTSTSNIVVVARLVH